ncbi:MAG: PspC domain-containing protein [Vicingaceae bacterium]
MKETVNINVSGVVFHIDVDAHQVLKDYLEKIRSFFNNSEEREEIMADIEARIAELFGARINEQKQVISKRDVEDIMQIMGRPEEFAPEEDGSDQGQQRPFEPHGKIRKRLFRDPEDRVLGGVASGIAAYIGVDPVWIRLFFVLGFFGGFVGFLFYIILWIIIPEARTASDRLRMKGEPINVENIGKSFKEGASKVNDRITDLSKASWSEKLENFFIQFFSALGTLIKGLFKAFAKVLGFLFFLIGILLALAIIGAIFSSGTVYSVGPSGIFSKESLDFLVYFFSSPSQLSWSKIALATLIAIPVIALIFGGFRLLFGVKGNSGIGIGLSILWFLALFVCLGIAVQVGSQFSSEGDVKEFLPLKSSFQDYVVRLDEQLVPGNELIQSSDEDFILHWDKSNFYLGYIDFTIKPGMGDSIALEVIKGANGPSYMRSIETAKKIDYHCDQDANLIIIYPYLKFSQEDKIRNQSVKVVMRLPVGKVVYLDPSLEAVLFDIDNVSGTWDRDMLGKRWVMLEEGLTCLDCSDIKGITSQELTDRLNEKALRLN